MILKGVGGRFEVETNGDVVICKARGRLKNQKIVPLVGDRVTLSIEPSGEGVIESVTPRQTELHRPAVANVDHAVVVTTLKSPPLNLQLLDRILVLCEAEGLDATVVINKADVASGDALSESYRSLGYPVIITSAKNGLGIDRLKEDLAGRLSVFTGPSGVGKSSLLNAIDPSLELSVGEISQKVKRGKHTTRHTALLSLDNGGKVVDTPGFTSLDLTPLADEPLDHFFPEFNRLREGCRFSDCKHLDEPGCAVKAALAAGEIPGSRYQSYTQLQAELEEHRRYKKW
jgi:ribosome biogenesis GTPase